MKTGFMLMSREPPQCKLALLLSRVIMCDMSRSVFMSQLKLSHIKKSSFVETSGCVPRCDQQLLASLLAVFPERTLSNFCFDFTIFSFDWTIFLVKVDYHSWPSLLTLCFRGNAWLWKMNESHFCGWRLAQAWSHVSALCSDGAGKFLAPRECL